MGIMSRLNDFAQLAAWSWRTSGDPNWRQRTLSNDTTLDGLLWGDQLWTVPSITGIGINQQTALNAAAVMACVTMIAEDVAKLPVGLFRKLDNSGRLKLKRGEHWLV